MNFQQLKLLRESHPAWRFLAARNVPLMASFLHRTFIAQNIRTIAEMELLSKLEDYLFYLQRGIESDLPQDAGALLDDWASDRCGWLRRYYSPENDEPLYDLAPATELALTWLSNLGDRSFIGTESRLIAIFQSLRELVQATESDPNVRVSQLRRQRAEIDAEIARIGAGRIDVLDPASVRDRFQEVVASARSLLSDFRAVEQNFRDLDRDVRERIATSESGKGELLDDVFGARDAITGSDQGKSFTGFWDLLMSEQRQEELDSLLRKVLDLEAVQQLRPDRRILRIHNDWIAAGEVTQRTVARLSSELRRYLDDKVWLENKRIMQILREIEQAALTVRDNSPGESFSEIDALAPTIGLAVDRPLFTPPMKPEIDDLILAANGEDIPAEALFNRVYVDKARLESNVLVALQRKDQVSLLEIVGEFPLEQGLAELVTYLSVAASDRDTIIDDRSSQSITWIDDEGNVRQASMPLVIFSRGRAAARHTSVGAV